MNPQVEKFLKLPTKIKVIALVVLVVLEIVGFYFLMYAPKIEELSTLQDQLERKQNEINQKRVIASGLAKFKEQYAKAQEELRAALEKLPDKKEIPSLLTSISTLAKDQGMDIKLFKPKGEVKKDFYAQVNVDLKMVGTYHDTALFFESVGSLKRIVNIGNISMRNSKSPSGITLVAVDCEINTYRFLDESELAAQNAANKKR